MQIRDIIAGLPRLTGSPIRISGRTALTAHRGKLLSAHLDRGVPVHAGCFIRKREIVVEVELFGAPSMLRLILLHEIFHFVWTRLGNPARNEFAALLRLEMESRARGELGESAAVKKNDLLAREPYFAGSLAWRDYVCESFCDTAAWLYSGVERHESFSLAQRWSGRRKRWFQSLAQSGFRC